jgi:hypothetical protein
MDTVLDRPWTTESFLAWEDRQEFKYEFDGRHVIPKTVEALRTSVPLSTYALF